MPDRIENLPGEFGEDIIRPAVGWFDVAQQPNGGNITPSLIVTCNETLSTEYQDHRAATFQCQRQSISDNTDVPLALIGIKLFTPALQGNTTCLT